MSEKRRASRGYTHDPYPCCGADGGPYGREKGTICSDCRALIDEGKAARERVKGEPLAVYGWTEAKHGWPRYYGVPGNFTRGDAHDQLANAMFDLINAVSLPAPADTPRQSPRWEMTSDYRGEQRRSYLPWPHVLPVEGASYDSWGFHTLRLLDPAVQAAVAALDQAIRVALESRFEAGKDRGRNLLLGLAQGEHTIADFEEGQLTERERVARRR